MVRIGITCTFTSKQRRDGSWSDRLGLDIRFCDWIRCAGGQPIVIPPTEDRDGLLRELEELDGARGTTRTTTGTTTGTTNPTQDDPRADALEELHIPMVTGTKITINGRTYAKGDMVTIAGDEYAVVTFKATAVKLHRQSDSAVYQLGINSRGRVTYVRLLGYATQ